MPEPTAFCRAVMHEYERQWSHASGHGVRHPLRIKMERLKVWCEESCSADDFDARLSDAEQSDDDALALLAEELLPLWRTVRAGGSLPFETR
jgi:hypothetical protein